VPILSGAVVVGLPQRGEKRPIVEPGGLLVAELVEGVAEQWRGLGLLNKTAGGELEEGGADLDGRLELDLIHGEGRQHLQVRGLQHAVHAQGVEADEQRVPGEAGRRLVGGVPVAGRPQRQDLP